MRFIINTLTHWDEPPRARHQVTFALAKKNEVAFVAANKIGLPGISINNLKRNLVVIQPFFPISVKIRYRVPIINELYQLWLFSRLKKKFGEVEIIDFDFTAHLIHLFFKKVYYYCNDNFSSISRKINIWPIYSYHSFCEQRLANRAGLCVGTSRIITANLLKMNDKSYEIPLGAPDIDEFDIKPQNTISKNQTLNIGLVGFISNYNLSYQLINDILKVMDCTITFIGPVEPEFYKNILDKKRIISKGALMDKELLSEVNKFDVAIAPYLDKKITEGGVPNKLFIYLALGKPVVATKLMSLSLMNLPDKLIYLIDKTNDFPAAISKAHRENTADLIKLRTDYAKMNTWDIRMEEFYRLLK